MGQREQKALLTRAAVVEAKRQVAAAAGDAEALRAAEGELSELWRQYLQIEDVQDDD